MEKYLGIKLVDAKRMSKESFESYKNGKLPSITENQTSGYMVKYPNGYESWCPKEAFEEANRSIKNMTFGHAIEALKKGYKIARKGWNGANMYAYYVEANKYRANTSIAKDEFGEYVPYRAYIALKTAQNDVATWSPSTSDALAEDWVIIE